MTALIGGAVFAAGLGGIFASWVVLHCAPTGKPMLRTLLGRWCIALAVAGVMGATVGVQLAMQLSPHY